MSDVPVQDDGFKGLPVLPCTTTGRDEGCIRDDAADRCLPRAVRSKDVVERPKVSESGGSRRVKRSDI